MCDAFPVEMQTSTQNFASAGLVIMLLEFSLLSNFSLKNFLFAHPGTGEYGILSDYDHDHEHKLTAFNWSHQYPSDS